MNTTLILLIAGNSKRFGGNIKKQFIEIDNKPIFMHTLISMLKFNFNNIVLVSSVNDIKNIKYIIENSNEINNNTKNQIYYVTGGSERVYSVYEAMKYLNYNKSKIKTDYVFIHDGVRPMVSIEEINSLYEETIKNDAAILASKIVDSIKKVDKHNNITNTIDRTCLYKAATPQAFKFYNYMIAIEKYINSNNNSLATDDSEIYSKYYGNVKIVNCSSKNIKITNKEDLNIFIKLK